MEIVSEKTRKKMSDSARRRCTSEWREKRSETLSTPINGELLRRLYTLGFTQIEIAKILNMTQKIIPINHRQGHSPGGEDEYNKN